MRARLGSRQTSLESTGVARRKPPSNNVSSSYTTGGGSGNSSSNTSSEGPSRADDSTSALRERVLSKRARAKQTSALARCQRLQWTQMLICLWFICLGMGLLGGMFYIIRQSIESFQQSSISGRTSAQLAGSSSLSNDISVNNNGILSSGSLAVRSQAMRGRSVLESFRRSRYEIAVKNEESQGQSVSQLRSQHGWFPDWKHALSPTDILPDSVDLRRKPKMECEFDSNGQDGFLAGCVSDMCKTYGSRREAEAACISDDMCTGILKVNAHREQYQCRSGLSVQESPSGERSFMKKCHLRRKKHEKISDEGLKRDSRNDKHAQISDDKAREMVICRIAQSSPKKGFIPGVIPKSKVFDTLEQASEVCEKNTDCVGITKDGTSGKYQMRAGMKGEAQKLWNMAAETGRSDDSVISMMPPMFNELSYFKRCERSEGRSKVSKRDKHRDILQQRMKEVGGLNDMMCVYDGPFRGFIYGCVMDESVNPARCSSFRYFWEATEACNRIGDGCGGITRVRVNPGHPSFQLRTGKVVNDYQSDEEFKQSQETSFLKNCDISRVKEVRKMDEQRNKQLLKYETVGSHEKIAGSETVETIYLGIASYRDSMCRESVFSAFSNSIHPQRVYVGVVEQNRDGDVPCLRLTTPEEERELFADEKNTMGKDMMSEQLKRAVYDLTCEDRPEHVFCRFKDHIRRELVDAKDAAGPVFGRHKADMLYRGEYFALQIDAHMTLIKDWDELAINEWRKTGNEYAVLTTYPSEVTTSVDKDSQKSTVKTAPVICRTRILANGMFKHESAAEFSFPKSVDGGNSPLYSPFLGAGVVFSRGHRIVRVPYDCCLPQVFDGEEFSLGMRLFTHGYDLYAPNFSFAFHPYNRKGAKKAPLFWENHDKQGQLQGSQTRIKVILKQMEDSPTLKYDRTDLQRYSLGSIRTPNLFNSMLGIDYPKRTVRNSCPKTFSGVLHETMQGYLRKDGKGIDYTRVLPALLDLA